LDASSALERSASLHNAHSRLGTTQSKQRTGDKKQEVYDEIQHPKERPQQIQRCGFCRK
jgi:hypothetical protein